MPIEDDYRHIFCDGKARHSVRAGLGRECAPFPPRQRRTTIPAWGNAPGPKPKTKSGLKARPIVVPQSPRLGLTPFAENDRHSGDCNPKGNPFKNGVFCSPCLGEMPHLLCAEK